MKRIFRTLGFLLLGLGGWDKDVILLIASMPKVEIQLLKYSKQVVTEVNKMAQHGTSGEWKRHVAFSVIQGKFPNFSKRQISMAIEIALG